MGTRVGLMSQMGPEQSGDSAHTAGSVLRTGMIFTLLSASIAGILITVQAASFLTPSSNDKAPAAAPVSI